MMDGASASNAPMVADLRDVVVRFSHLRAYGKSAMHGYHARISDSKTTYAMQRGTAVHAILFNTRKVCGYQGNRDLRQKAYQEFVAANPDTEILTMAEFDKARAMADAVRASQEAALVMAGVYETTLRFSWNGMDCRATPDIRGPEYLTELKTSASSDPARFQWHALRMAYPAQLWFQHIAAELNGLDVSRHFIVCVEASAPHPVTVFEVQPRALEMGARQLVLWSERLKTSEASAAFPPYSSAIVPLDVPEDDEALVFGDEDDEQPQQKKSALEYFTAG